MKKSRKIWRVRVEDSQYMGQSDQFLLRGETAADVEKAALKMVSNRDGTLPKGDPPREPYVRNIELIGSLNN